MEKLLLLLIIPFLSFGQNKKDYWENGQLYIDENYNNGLLHGPYKQYYENGQLEKEGSYKDGYREGLWQEYWENGQQAGSGNYINGEYDGQWFHAWRTQGTDLSKGQKYISGNYRNGVKSGTWRGYYENRNLWYNIFYADGDPFIEEVNETGYDEEEGCFDESGKRIKCCASRWGDIIDCD